MSGEWASPPERRRKPRTDDAVEGKAGQWNRLDAEAPEGNAVDPAELREFLAADLEGSKADPKFKRQLRQRLWKWFRARSNGD